MAEIIKPEFGADLVLQCPDCGGTDFTIVMMPDAETVDGMHCSNPDCFFFFKAEAEEINGTI